MNLQESIRDDLNKLDESGTPNYKIEYKSFNRGQIKLFKVSDINNAYSDNDDYSNLVIQFDEESVDRPTMQNGINRGFDYISSQEIDRFLQGAKQYLGLQGNVSLDPKYNNDPAQYGEKTILDISWNFTDLDMQKLRRYIDRRGKAEFGVGRFKKEKEKEEYF